MLESPIPTRGAGWAVLQLTSAAENLPVLQLDRELTHSLPTGRFFFPAIADQRPAVDHPLSSYVFFVADLPDGQLLRVERCRYVLLVLKAGRQIQRVPDKELRVMLSRELVVKDLEIGTLVQVMVGDWAGLDGRIVKRLPGSKVRVRIELHSLQQEITLARHEFQVL